MQGSERLVLVSNRLPVTLERTAEGVSVRLSAGGVATGLSRPHREGRGPWIGWPGTLAPDGRLEPDVEAALREEGMVGVPLTPREYEAYYSRFCNACLWPLFHYFTGRVRFSSADWQAYRDVNRKFADVVLRHAHPDDLVFVQDFHLLLLPALLRAAQAQLRIGFFLHTPFPSTEIYRILPPREEVLQGLLGADMIGFHTLDYVRHFRVALRRVLGADVRGTDVFVAGRRVRLLAQPLGLDGGEWAARGSSPEAQAEEARLRAAAGSRRVILGVDRLDYTKGIPRRLRAFEELLRGEPGLVERVLMIQVAVPSRVEVQEYRALKDDVDRIAGRINSEFGRPERMPLHYMFRSVSPAQLAALYRVADVALVTPLRDGLNLVAKEYVASRERDDGVLIIGEFTGAAWELGEALHVNPFDVDGMAAALRRALDMSPEEQARRMGPMRERVRRNDVDVWTRACVAAIRSAHRAPPTPWLRGAARHAAAERWRAARSRHLFLDYDGTLVPLAPTPAAAAPEREVVELLAALAAAPGVHPWIVSGRPPEVLRDWLGETGAGLVAEHGACVRRPGAAEFTATLASPPPEWRAPVLEVLRSFADRVPASFVEEKPFGVAWHYRLAEQTFAAQQARELFHFLDEVTSAEPVQVLRGHKVVEVRPLGVDKGSTVLQLLRETGRPGDFVLAAGDDRTDEDLFRRAGADVLTLCIGEHDTAARFRLAGPEELRALLREWLSLLAGTTAEQSGG